MPVRSLDDHGGWPSAGLTCRLGARACRTWPGRSRRTFDRGDRLLGVDVAAAGAGDIRRVAGPGEQLLARAPWRRGGRGWPSRAGSRRGGCGPGARPRCRRTRVPGERRRSGRAPWRAGRPWTSRLSRTPGWSACASRLAPRARQPGGVIHAGRACRCPRRAPRAMAVGQAVGARSARQAPGACLGCGRVTHGHVRPFDRGAVVEPRFSGESCHCMQACGALAKFPRGVRGEREREAAGAVCGGDGVPRPGPGDRGVRVRSSRRTAGRPEPGGSGRKTAGGPAHGGPPTGSRAAAAARRAAASTVCEPLPVGPWAGSWSRLSVRRSTMVGVRSRSTLQQGAGSDGPPQHEDPAARRLVRGENPRHRRRRRDAGLLPRVRVLGHLLPRPARRARRPQAGAPPHRLPDERDGPAPRARVRQVRPRRRRGHGQAAPARRHVDGRSRPRASMARPSRTARPPGRRPRATSVRWATTIRRPPCGTPSAGWPRRRA
ncbi:hypothetical protein SVIOM74S_08894 [Streptomyces violarus]